MIIIGIDYGDARTGVSVCDKNEMIAVPVTVIKERNPSVLIQKILDIAVQHKAEMIVVGKPLNMNGSCGSRAQKCMNFAQKIEAKTGIKTDVFDERMTTQIAHRALNFTNTRGNARKTVVDALSAQIILQDFIDAKKK